MTEAVLDVERLGRRGEGLAQTASGLVAVPYALPGERASVTLDGERAHVEALLLERPDRLPAFCPYYTHCGGCAVQTLPWPPYADWKRGLVAQALAREKLDPPLAALVDAHGAGRRRATFHARLESGRMVSGFMRARSHDIIAIEGCPILAPALAEAPRVAQALARALSAMGKPLDIAVTATEAGLDVDLRGCGPLLDDLQRGLAALAGRLDLARLSNHGAIIIERRAPTLRIGRASVAPPPGGFLQATAEGEAALAALVTEGVGDARRVADLFAGTGAFALRLAERADVHAVEEDAAALAALARAAGATPGLRAVTTEARDLRRRPLAPPELARFEAVVFDPPRAGAEPQARALAASVVPRVVAVACDAASFARDARILVEGGYAFKQATPIDQFKYSPHVEIAGLFTKKAQPKRRGRLLG